MTAAHDLKTHVGLLRTFSSLGFTSSLAWLIWVISKVAALSIINQSDATC